MKMDLDEMLKAADPAAGSPGLSRAESARMRRAVLEEAGRAPSGPGWITILAGAGVAAAALLLVLVLPLPELTAPPRERASREPGDAGRTVRAAERRARSSMDRRDARPPRRIQFTTRGGTRIIWTLDPDFEV